MAAPKDKDKKPGKIDPDAFKQSVSQKTYGKGVIKGKGMEGIDGDSIEPLIIEQKEIPDTSSIGEQVGETESLEEAEEAPPLASATNPALNDSASERDSIGFTLFVNALARMVVHKKTITPLTIGVMGPWGSGKTSFMKQLKNQVKQLDSDIKHVEFNAWKYDVQKNLWAAFLQAIVLQIENGLCWGQRKRIKLRSIWKKIGKFQLLWNCVLTAAIVSFSYYILDKLEVELQWSLIVLIPFGVLGFLINPMTDIWKKLKMPLGIDIGKMFSEDHIVDNIENFNDFESDLKRILDLYVGKDGKLIIYIDDLDRCSPRKVVDILETINVFLDTYRCIFILGIDKPKVVMAINIKFSEHAAHVSQKGGSQAAINDFGEGFLEKIIQIPIFIPKLSLDALENFLDEYFSGFASEEYKTSKSIQKIEEVNLIDLELDYKVETVLRNSIEHIDRNPRGIKRYLNIFRYIHLLYIMNKDTFKDVDEALLPFWFYICYKNRKDMKDFEVRYFNKAWTDIISDKFLKEKGANNLYQDLAANPQFKNILENNQRRLKGYFNLTRLLYE